MWIGGVKREVSIICQLASPDEYSSLRAAVLSLPPGSSMACVTFTFTIHFILRVITSDYRGDLNRQPFRTFQDQPWPSFLTSLAGNLSFIHFYFFQPGRHFSLPFQSAEAPAEYLCEIDGTTVGISIILNLEDSSWLIPLKNIV